MKIKKIKNLHFFKQTCKSNHLIHYNSFFQSNILNRFYSTKSFIQNKEIRERLEQIEQKYEKLNQQLTKVNKKKNNKKQKKKKKKNKKID